MFLIINLRIFKSTTFAFCCSKERFLFTILFESRTVGSASERYSFPPGNDCALTFAPYLSKSRTTSIVLGDKQPQAICKGVKYTCRAAFNRQLTCTFFFNNNSTISLSPARTASARTGNGQSLIEGSAPRRSRSLLKQIQPDIDQQYENT